MPRHVSPRAVGQSSVRPGAPLPHHLPHRRPRHAVPRARGRRVRPRPPSAAPASSAGRSGPPSPRTGRHGPWRPSTCRRLGDEGVPGVAEVVEAEALRQADFRASLPPLRPAVPPAVLDTVGWLRSGQGSPLPFDGLSPEATHRRLVLRAGDTDETQAEYEFRRRFRVLDWGPDRQRDGPPLARPGPLRAHAAVPAWGTPDQAPQGRGPGFSWRRCQPWISLGFSMTLQPSSTAIGTRAAHDQPTER